MGTRRKIPPEVADSVLANCRRRCCLCHALRNDNTEKKGQIAHLDHDRSNNDPDNLVYLCLEHHDAYDSRTSQSKGLTIGEVKRHRTVFAAFFARDTHGLAGSHGPVTDADVVTALTVSLDRPAFRTPFRQESSLPRFRKAIAETIQTLNTGKTPQGKQMPSKNDSRDPGLRVKVDEIVEALVALRASFDRLLREGEIRHCGCDVRACPVYFLSEHAAEEMDSRRQAILNLAHDLNPGSPKTFYRLR